MNKRLIELNLISYAGQLMVILFQRYEPRVRRGWLRKIKKWLFIAIRFTILMILFKLWVWDFLINLAPRVFFFGSENVWTKEDEANIA